MTEIEQHAHRNFEVYLKEGTVDKYLHGKENDKDKIIDQLKVIFTYAFIYGSNFTNKVKINYSKVREDKINMLDKLLEFGDGIKVLGTSVFDRAFEEGCNKDKSFIEPPYYSIKIEKSENDFFTTYDYNTKSLKVYKSIISNDFFNALNETNKDKAIYKLTDTIADKDKFKDLIANNEWGSKFIFKYLFPVYTNCLYIFVFDYIRSDSEVTRTVNQASKKNQNILDNLKKELKNMGYTDDIIDFHLEIASEISRAAYKLSIKQDVRELMSFIYGNKKYRDNEDGILRLETFISSNIEG
ncbi:hypothetical protein [Evansella tamaricis]|uniref:Uncharacterized protein n=1 Tax=Evansella tamaricis TaxID=2069301 RepID=A0ABS6JHQ5_9BACI|nr:hypothetical protein [Evansella tamaricis]MBU9713200.1 hypothetical protein [Evansella tamaricis]